MSPEALAKGGVSMYFVYLLGLSDRSIYTGSTHGVRHRVLEHQKGKVLSTRKLRPLALIWYCAFRNRLEASRFEIYLKTGSGQAFRNKHII